MRCALPPSEARTTLHSPSPAVFAHQGHTGPVYGVATAGGMRGRIYASASTDSAVRVFHGLQARPFMVLEARHGYIYSLAWSPARHSILAAGTGDGSLVIFNLLHGATAPAAVLHPNPNPSYSTNTTSTTTSTTSSSTTTTTTRTTSKNTSSAAGVVKVSGSGMTTGGSRGGGSGSGAINVLAFNTRRPRLVATGDANGNVQIWSLSDDFLEAVPGEAEKLLGLAEAAMM